MKPCHLVQSSPGEMRSLLFCSGSVRWVSTVDWPDWPVRSGFASPRFHKDLPDSNSKLSWLRQPQISTRSSDDGNDNPDCLSNIMTLVQTRKKKIKRHLRFQRVSKKLKPCRWFCDVHNVHDVMNTRTRWRLVALQPHTSLRTVHATTFGPHIIQGFRSAWNYSCFYLFFGSQAWALVPWH